MGNPVVGLPLHALDRRLELLLPHYLSPPLPLPENPQNPPRILTGAVTRRITLPLARVPDDGDDSVTHCADPAWKANALGHSVLLESLQTDGGSRPPHRLRVPVDSLQSCPLLGHGRIPLLPSLPQLREFGHILLNLGHDLLHQRELLPISGAEGEGKGEVA